MSARIRFPKKSKGKQHNKPQPVNQDDFYLEAIDFEEQAERWLLSDIKRALRLYLKAYEMYEMGLVAPEPTEKCTYNILYNETRLLLQLHFDYMENNGYINILQYLNLDDIEGVHGILKTLPEIIERFEIVLNKYETIVDTWDLQSNLLNSYLSLIENYDKCELSSEQILQLVNKFTTLSQNLILYQINETEKNNEAIINDTKGESGDDSFTRDSLGDASAKISNDGSGVDVNNEHSTDNGELMEVSDDVTSETLSEVLINCLKFNQSLLEIMIESKFEQEQLLNVVQLNYLDDIVNKQLMSLNDIIESHSHLGLNMNDIKLVEYAITGIKLLYGNASEQDLETYLSQPIPVTIPVIDEIDFNLVKIDIIEVAINCVPDDLIAMKWKLCTQLNVILTETRNKLTAFRQSIIASHDQSDKSKLSHVVFQLCDVTITAASNELQRYQIKANASNEDPSASKVQAILLKNAKTLLTNAQIISEKSCGMQETIVDKLKRNYIYNDAKNRIATLPLSID